MGDIGGITRREIFRYIGKSIGGLTLVTAVPASQYIIDEYVRRPTITFEQAKADKSLRQEYLNQLLEWLVGKDAVNIYVNQLVYDDDGSLTFGAHSKNSEEQFKDPRSTEHIRRLLQRPGYLEKAVKDYMQRDQFSGLSAEEAYDAAKKLLQGNTGALSYSSHLKEDSIERAKREGRDLTAPSTIHNAFDIGQGKKSTIYIPGNVFDDRTVNIRFEGFKIISKTEPITEIDIIPNLIHEFQHAVNHYKGIYLTPSLTISSDNFIDIDPSVSGIIDENSAEIRAINFLKKYNKIFGENRYNPAFMDSINGFRILMEFTRDSLATFNHLTEFEKRLLTHSMKPVDKILNDYGEITKNAQ